MKLNKILVIPFVVASLSICSQTVVVVNQNTFEPLEGVNISTQAKNLLGITNVKGVLKMKNVSQTDTIIFQRIGFKMYKMSVKDMVVVPLDTCCNDNAYTVFLIPENFNLDEVVITASKFKEKKIDVPKQIDVIEARQIQQDNPQTTADVLMNSGNLFVQKSQMGGGSPVIRGFETNKILLVLDGIRMNNAIYRGGHLQNIITVDNAILDKMEIVYGPGSVIYGSDALGGVIHMVTKNPVLSKDTSTFFSGSFYSRFASANSERSAHLDFNMGGKKLASLSSISLHSFGDLRQGSYRMEDYDDWGKCKYFAVYKNEKDSMVKNSNVNIQRRSGYKQYDFLEKIMYKPNENTSHLINFQFSTSSDIQRYDRLSQYQSNDTLKYGDWYYGPQKRLLGAYEFLNTKKTKLSDELHVTIAYQNIEESRNTRKFGQYSLDSRKELLHILSLNTDFEKGIKEQEFRYGIEGQYNDVQSTAFTKNIITGKRSELDTRYPDGGSVMSTMAAYFTHTWEAGEHFLIHDGIRYSFTNLESQFIDTSFYHFPFSKVNQQNGSFNGEIGFVFKDFHQWHIGLNFSSGYRVPNVDDVGKVFDSQPGLIVVPNSNLKPEYAYTGELSVDKIIGKSVRVQTTGFYTLYKDAITTQPFQFNGQDSIDYNGVKSRVIANVNATEAYIYGFSARVKLFLWSDLSITSLVNYTYGRIKTDSTDYPLSHIPPIYGRTSLHWSHKKLQIEIFSLYNAWKHKEDYYMFGEDNFNYATSDGTPAWYTLNIGASYRYNATIMLQAQIENILDLYYRPFAAGISAPGRSVVLTIRASF